MAKQSTTSIKTTFGKRRVGKPAKRKGPKDKSVKKYIGQGR